MLCQYRAREERKQIYLVATFISFIYFNIIYTQVNLSANLYTYHLSTMIKTLKIKFYSPIKPMSCRSFRELCSRAWVFRCVLTCFFKAIWCWYLTNFGRCIIPQFESCVMKAFLTNSVWDLYNAKYYRLSDKIIVGICPIGFWGMFCS